MQSLERLETISVTGGGPPRRSDLRPKNVATSFEGINGKRFATALQPNLYGLGEVSYTRAAKGYLRPSDDATRKVFENLQTAIRAFQQKAGMSPLLKVDGLLGTQTITARNSIWPRVSDVLGVGRSFRSSLDDQAREAERDTNLIKEAVTRIIAAPAASTDTAASAAAAAVEAAVAAAGGGPAAAAAAGAAAAAATRSGADAAEAARDAAIKAGASDKVADAAASAAGGGIGTKGWLLIGALAVGGAYWYKRRKQGKKLFGR